MCGRCAAEGLPCVYKASRRGQRTTNKQPNERELLEEAEPNIWFMQLDATAPDEPKTLRSFHFYRERTSHDLHGSHDELFWTSSILRLSQTQPAIMHMLTALGALHEALERAYSLHQAGQTQPPRIVSLQQYDRAICLVRQESHDLPITVLLVACILFVCFETLQQDYASASRSLNSGYAILDRRDVSKVHPGSIEDEVVHVFLRLRLQASTYITTAAEKSRQGPAGIVEKLWVTAPYTSNPEFFSSLQHAKTTFNDIHDQAYSVMDSITGVPDYRLTRKLHGRFDDQLVTWFGRWEEFLQRSQRDGIAPREETLFLRIQYLVSRIFAQGVTHNDEMHFDYHVCVHVHAGKLQLETLLGQDIC